MNIIEQKDGYTTYENTNKELVEKIKNLRNTTNDCLL